MFNFESFFAGAIKAESYLTVADIALTTRMEQPQSRSSVRKIASQNLFFRCFVALRKKAALKLPLTTADETSTITEHDAFSYIRNGKETKLNLKPKLMLFSSYKTKRKSV